MPRPVYILADPRLKECPKCWGSDGTLYTRATWNDPEDSEACEECGGTGTVSRKVNVYRKRKCMKEATT